MRLRFLAAATVFCTVAASCGLKPPIRTNLPAYDEMAVRVNVSGPAEPMPVHTPQPKKESCARTFLAKLLDLIKKNNVVLIGESHRDISHYGELISGMKELSSLGIKTIYLELDQSFNTAISNYQDLVRAYNALSSDPSANNDAIRKLDLAVDSASNALAKSLNHRYVADDVSMTGFVMALISSAATNNVRVICIDRKRNGLAIDEANLIMAGAITSSLGDGKAIALVGISHTEGMKSSLLSSRITTETLQSLPTN